MVRLNWVALVRWEEVPEGLANSKSILGPPGPTCLAGVRPEPVVLWAATVADGSAGFGISQLVWSAMPAAMS